MEFISRSPKETEKIAQKIADYIVPGDNICLQGKLGSGKTFLVRSLLKFLGYQGLITSPTFTLVNEYPINIKDEEIILLHADVYRLEKYIDSELGLEEALNDNKQVVMIEWADMFSELKVMLSKTISLSIDGDGESDETRKIMLTGFR